MDKRGWVKIYRELMYKPIWTQTTPEQKVILITILLKANYEENTWPHRGKLYNCKPGQFITSLESLAAECGKGVTIQNIRTAIKLFENLGFLTNQSTKSGRLITVVNWGKYQLEDDEPTNEVTKSQQRTNKEPTNSLTTNKEIKNDKNEKNKKKGSITPRPEHTEIIDYLNTKTGSDYKTTTAATQKAINGRLDEGYTVENFKAVIDVKVSEWSNDEKMRQYLCPDTLFRPSNFEKYLQQAKAQKPKCENPHSGIYSMLQQRDAPDWKQKHAEETEAKINNISSDDYPFA